MMYDMSVVECCKVTSGIFYARKNTSDMKAYNEVVLRNSYQRPRSRDASTRFTIERGETWIDIGANVGAFMLMAAHCGADVICYEPDPENFALLQLNYEANKQKGIISNASRIHCAGLHEKKSESYQTLYCNTAGGNVWRNSLYKPWRGGEEKIVRILPVDGIWSKDVCIKLDAEGAEMPILEKYASKRVKKLVFEWSFDIDPSLDRFNNVITKLEKVYPSVYFTKIADGYSEWQKSWFPACRTVWAQ